MGCRGPGRACGRAAGTGPGGQAGDVLGLFDKVKAGYASSWALGCRDLPAGRASLFIQRGSGTVTDCRVTEPGDQPEATYVLGMDYADWRVAGLPVAVHDDVAEARSAAAHLYHADGELPNYQRILSRGGIAGPAEAVIADGEDSVAAQVRALFEAGATDVWAAPFPVGDGAAASRARTRAPLTVLARN